MPEKRTLPVLRAAVQDCHGCPLYRGATQAVFGEGRARARVMMIGEQPGDREDLEGRPFVGPAGRLLDEVLEVVGIERGDVYVTNAVKHFKYTLAPRGKRRIHAKPTRYEVGACKPWLAAELAVVKPAIVVLLGATAAQALLGSAFRVTEQRGQVMATAIAARTVATVHPAAVLRAVGAEGRRVARAQFEADLRVVRDVVRELRPPRGGGPSTV